MKGHKCWDLSQPDPPPLDDDVQPPKSALDKALLNFVYTDELNSYASTAKGNKLLAAGADFESSM